MLTIRRPQFEALSDARVVGFEDRTLRHLQRWMPRHCRVLGEAQMRVVIRHGLTRASAHGLGLECTVIGYIDLMCLLGSGFDTDPLLPWVAPVLQGGPAREDPVVRADRLYDAAWAYIDTIVGDYRDTGGRPLTERLVVLLREARAAPRDAPADDDAFDQRLLATLATYFPAKAAATGTARLAALAAAGRRRAQQHGFASERGMLLVTALMFILGNGFDEDPLLPWVSTALTSGEPEAVRIDQLFVHGADMLRRWWTVEPRH